MIPLFTPDQVRTLDERAIDRGTAAAVLMERAAGFLARATLAAAGRAYGLRVAIVCGKGNNGGDGLAAGRRLLAAGAVPRVAVVGGEDGLSGLPRRQLERYRAAGGRVATVDEALRGADVVVDCLLGTGTSGELREPYAAAATAINAAGMPVVACDLPSGVDADTGRVPGVAVEADVTVTLGAHKRGLWLWPARGHCGRLLLADIGILEGADQPAAAVLEPADVAALVPAPPDNAHKRSHGVVAILAGSPGMAGAATLVARGAMAGGAGLVTVATSATVRDLVAPTIPEALTVALPDDPDAAFDELAAHLDSVDALAVGPGLGHAPPTVALVRRLVREVQVPVVLDADGLNAFRAEGDLLADHAAALLVGTPHAKELARLVGGSGHGIWGRRFALVPEKATAWNAVLVAKGPGSIVAAPDGRVWVNPTGGPALATGGTGDVLTGITAAFVAQDASPERVAAAVWVHGRAGLLAGRGRRARAVTALDVASAVPDVLAELDATDVVAASGARP